MYKNFIIYIAILLLTSCATTTTEEKYKDINIYRAEKFNEKSETLSQEEKNLSAYHQKKYKKEIDLISKNIYRISQENFGEPFITGYLVESKRRSIYVDPLNNIVIPSGFLGIFNTKNGFNEDDFTYIVCHEFSHIIRNDWSRNMQNSELDSFLRNFNPEFYLSVTPILFTEKGATKAEISASASANINAYKLYEKKFSDKDANNLEIFKFDLKQEVEADIEAIRCMAELKVNYKPSTTLKKLYELNEVTNLTNRSSLETRINEVLKYESQLN